MEVITTEARYGWAADWARRWYSYPDRDLAAVLLTQCLPPPEPLVDAFWSTLHSTCQQPPRVVHSATRTRSNSALKIE